MRRVVGVDVGGTFTDLLLYEVGPQGSQVRLAKILTTAANQADGVLAAIANAGTSPRDLDLVIHGTTTTTNAVLERKVATVGLITTAGFRDTLELGRRTRPRPYGMTGTFEPLIPRERRLEVDERMNVDGGVVTPLDEAEVRGRGGPARRHGLREPGHPLPAFLRQSRRTSCARARLRARSGRTRTSRSATSCSRSSASTSVVQPPRSMPRCSRSSTATCADCRASSRARASGATCSS